MSVAFGDETTNRRFHSSAWLQFSQRLEPAPHATSALVAPFMGNVLGERFDEGQVKRHIPQRSGDGASS